MSEQVLQAAGSANATTQSREQHRGLLLIGLFKLSKCVFFFFMGLGVVHLLHAELGNEVMRLAQLLHFDPEWRVVSVLVEKVDLIDTHRMRQIGFFSFAYSIISLVEGYGLMTGKVWAEYLTLSLTCLALPWELFELARGPSWGRVTLLVINLVVLAYLLWLLKKKKVAAVTA